MKKIGEIMAEMGFNKNAPDSVKESFIKYLMNESNKQPIKQLNKKTISADEIKNDPTEKQLDLFDYASRKVI